MLYIRRLLAASVRRVTTHSLPGHYLQLTFHASIPLYVPSLRYPGWSGVNTARRRNPHEYTLFIKYGVLRTAVIDVICSDVLHEAVLGVLLSVVPTSAVRFAWERSSIQRKKESESFASRRFGPSGEYTMSAMSKVGKGSNLLFTFTERGLGDLTRKAWSFRMGIYDEAGRLDNLALAHIITISLPLKLITAVF